MDSMVGFTPEGSSTLSIIGLAIVIYQLSFGFSVAMYILEALGLYTIADRRGIRHPWMAWLPMVNMWILGSVADQYQYVARGQVRSRRKVLLGLSIARFLVSLILAGGCVWLLVSFFMNIPRLEYVFERMYVEPLLFVLGTCGVAEIIAIVLLVFQYVAYYNLYASCDPKHKGLFTVLSILFPVTQAFFVFACRTKELGMPPRRDSVAAAAPKEAAEAPEV